MIGLRTLVLNADMNPISLMPLQSIPAEDAVTRVVNGTCRIIDEYDRKILTPTVEMRWPSVVARVDYLHHSPTVNLTAESLYYRDHGVCQYCEKPLKLTEITIDHVHPRSRGGQKVWHNVVAACPTCNFQKGDASPQGQWEPRNNPWVPNYWDLLKLRRRFPIYVKDASWIDWIGPWDAEVRVAA